MGIKPLEPRIMKKWDKFLEWMYEKKHLMRKAWMPCYMSIELWEEFNGRLKK